jgi:four helix bundle protein
VSLETILAPRRLGYHSRMGFERFRAYAAAQQLRDEVDRLYDGLKPGEQRRVKNMLSELDRAVDSILNNIAEGNDSVYPDKKKHFFDLACGSSEEARNGSGLS